MITVNDAPPVTVSPATNVTNKQTTKPRRAPRKIGPIKQREYDPDKHCGVVSTETMKPCTWSLTCKVDFPSSYQASITQSYKTLKSQGFYKIRTLINEWKPNNYDV